MNLKFAFLKFFLRVVFSNEVPFLPRRNAVLISCILVTNSIQKYSWNQYFTYAINV